MCYNFTEREAELELVELFPLKVHVLNFKSFLHWCLFTETMHLKCINTKIAEFANSIDPDRWLKMSCLIEIYIVCPVVFKFSI